MIIKKGSNLMSEVIHYWLIYNGTLNALIIKFKTYKNPSFGYMELLIACIKTLQGINCVRHESRGNQLSIIHIYSSLSFHVYENLMKIQ